MSDKTSTKLLKVVGVVHIIFAILMLLAFIRFTIAYFDTNNIESMLISTQMSTDTLFPEVLFLKTTLQVRMAIFLASGAMYAVTAYGFFNLKRWLPTLLTIIFTVSVALYFIAGITLLLSEIFYFIWIGILILTWQNKHLFKN
ncbi:hypothetical protein KC717_04610 [Candidatus Dojkabacteria bacterium]|uniref:Uncharacterized protein n=1 Tax=Candidatus Dojkabacteria bacterium TaxID=2099670 RepID=A0A955RKL4_9BACT|nr:hypothetical protein [Candidatus Dojkabacteria bacterium]